MNWRLLISARAVLVAATALLSGCGADVGPPVEAGGSYWPAADKTHWVHSGRWEDLSGNNLGGELTIETYIAGTDYDAQGRPVKKWLTREVDGPYYFRITNDEVWANWEESNPKGTYRRWLILPPHDGQRWEDDKYRVRIDGPFDVDVPFGRFKDVYRARYEYVQEPGHYEIWWYAPGVGCIKYEHLIPGEKHELVSLTTYQPGR